MGNKKNAKSKDKIIMLKIIHREKGIMKLITKMKIESQNMSDETIMFRKKIYKTNNRNAHKKIK